MGHFRVKLNLVFDCDGDAVPASFGILCDPHAFLKKLGVTNKSARLVPFAKVEIAPARVSKRREEG